MMTKQQKRLKRRTADEWIKKIILIKDIDIQTKVALLVWWDYVKNDDISWHVFEKYVNRKIEREPSSEVIKKALIEIGYLRAKAKKRSTLPKDSNEKK